MRKKLGVALRTSTIYRATRVLTVSDRRKVGIVSLFQILFGLLDLAGIALVGIMGALAINGVSSKKPGDRVNSILEFFHLADSNLQNQFLIIGLVTTLLLIGKTILSVVFTRRIVFFLSRRGAIVSTNLVSRLLSKSLVTINSKSVNEMSYAITSGVESLTLGILSTFIAVVSDVSLLFILACGLFLVDSTIAFSTFFFFGTIGFLLYRFMHVYAHALGNELQELSIKSNQMIFEVLVSYREAVVSHRRSYYAKKIGEVRMRLADIAAEIGFMPNVSKYVIEIAMVIGSLVIGFIQFSIHDVSHAVAVLAVFMAATTRIAPAILRIQQSMLKIRGSLGSAQSTLNLIDEIGYEQVIEEKSPEIDFIHEGFVPEVSLENVSFKYPGKNKLAVSEVSLEIKQGEVVALVGPSGAGKTTLIDLILGVLDPLSGRIFLSGLIPSEAVKKWPGAIGYVPQDVIMSNTSILGNVALGYPLEGIAESDVLQAIHAAQLSEFVQSLSGDLNSHVGDHGRLISGGQRQRLGIARALFSKPLLLVLDEATSALDGETEANISKAIQLMKGNVTVVMIAHRLSTVRHADKVIYMAEGRVIAEGTFDFVRAAVPDFDNQAQLMGL
ncbi:MAG: ABC transporter ATP-binding protein [Terrimicrobiaceae bacterium]